MPRLFVAVRPPRPIRDLLRAAMGGVAGARWQTDDQLHLTLRFLGEVDRHAAADVHAALAAIHHPRFDIALDGFGTFDRRGIVNALWAGVTPHAPLKTLHNKIDQACARAGIRPDERAFTPHITLARLNRASGPVAGFAEAAPLTSEPFTVDDFALYESELTPAGSIYSIVERYSLV